MHDPRPRSPRIAARTCASIFLAALALTLAVAPACGESSETFCQSFCSAYVDCLDEDGASGGSGGGGGSAPGARALFCSGAQDRRPEQCETSCLSTLDLLAEESRSFIGCARCVLDATAGEGICSKDTALQIGQLACSDQCEDSRTLESALYFYGELEEDVTSNGSVCERAGVETWDANDPAIGHRMGEQGPSGTWVCDPCDTSWHVFYGPTLPTLPPGRYRAGARDVRLTGGTPIRTVGILEVGYEPDTWPFQVTLEPADFPGGVAAEIAVDFELTVEQTNVQPRWSYYADNGATALSIGEIFVQRK